MENRAWYGLGSRERAICCSPVQYSKMQPIIQKEEKLFLWEDAVGLTFVFLSL